MSIRRGIEIFLSTLLLLVSFSLYEKAAWALNRYEAREYIDTQIESNVIEALSVIPAFQTQPIEAQVRDGVVRLEGTVSSSDEKTLASEVAREVNGIRNVLNKISVDSHLATPNQNFTY